MNWLSIPKSGLVNRRIPKSMFYEQAVFSKQEKQIFTDYLDSIRIIGLLNQDVMSAQPLVSADINYTDISVLLVQIKDMEKCKKISKLIHKSIPYPVLMFLYNEEQVIVSTALKRIHHVKKSESVVDEIALSHEINVNGLQEADQAFVSKLHLETLPYTNFYRLYQEIHYRIKITKVIDFTGVYPVNLGAAAIILQRLDQVLSLSEEIKKLRGQLSTEKNFAKKMDLHVIITIQEKQLSAIIEQLKEVC
ncbi:DUF4391 domain-containing protein [Paenibacillus endophyticus]|nr:DUF4391 domain-containing protein [Paenibacillus endophyticus]